MKETIKVLMVDDDREDYLITKELLCDVGRRQRYKVDWVASPAEAEAEILRGVHDVYLIDYRIGEYSGLELIRSLRAQGCEAPLILLTGQSSAEIDEEAMHSGASDFLVKGRNNPGELLDRAIRYEIRHYRDLRKIRRLNATLEKRVQERTNTLAETVSTLAAANEKLRDTIAEKEKIAAALKESQPLYSAMARNFPSGFIGVLNSSYEFVFADGAELNRSGHLKNRMKGSCFLSFLPEEVRTQALDILKKAFEGLSGEFHAKIDGRVFQINLEPLKSEQADSGQLLVVLKDITHQKQTEEHIRKAWLKEVELNEMKSRFVSMASHEFRTPLGAISTSLSLIEQYVKPEPESRAAKHFKRIYLSMKQLTEILNDFLSIDKLEQGKIESSREKFNLKELMEDMVEEMEGILKQGQRIEFNYSGQEEIYQDKKILQNIVLNLLTNASKYSEEGKHTELDVKVNDRNVSVCVTDHGIGIPEEDQPFLFSRFFRASNTGNIPGTGLGLNIVQRYVEMLRGSIRFQSAPQRGTTFTVDFEY